MTTTTATSRHLATDLHNPLAAATSGELAIAGDALAFRRFTGRFRRGL